MPTEPTFEWVDIGRIVTNSWNPNLMDGEMYAKAIESIHEFGFVDPVTVRSRGKEFVDATTYNDVAEGKETKLDVTKFQLIDGEHRWRAAKDHGNCVRAKNGWERHVGLQRLPITNLGDVSDEDAQQLTIVLNETRGSYDPKKMGKLLVELVAVKPMPELLTLLPFDKLKFEELAQLPSVDWNSVTPSRPTSSGSAERWVERIFRLPPEAAKTLDEAIEAARAPDRTKDWEALQAIAESFLEIT